MSLQDRLRQQLVSTRQFTERLLEAFETPEQWTFQVLPGSNHALWFAGHIGHADNFFISLLAPDQAVSRPGWGELFGMGSQPSPKVEEYPPVPEILSYLRERRETLLALLDRYDDGALATKTPPKTPEFLADYGSIFQMASWHEGMHAGQLTVARRALGHGPVMGPPPA